MDPQTYGELHWARTALQAGKYSLAGRYLDNAIARSECAICRERLTIDDDTEYVYERRAHWSCIAKHGTRTDYLRQVTPPTDTQ